jgi:cysteinyl-tRNA synthetase
MREVRIRDTLSGALQSIDPGHEVGIYACGPTVYSRIHIGNARPYVVFSLFARFLRSEGFKTRLVVNVTDINDKIYTAAARAGEPSAKFAAEMTAAYVSDTDALGVGRPDAEPRATETVEGIVELIADLIEGGHAYESGGDVYFRVRSFADYGKLSNRRPEDMDQGEEAGTAGLKEERLDFALWKATKEGEDTSWDSPWGPGRPAWHIECSVMAEQELGASFAVHGGGSDLVFPHHENEIAQSEAAGRPFAHVWMHNGMVDTGGEKMSKSEGNIFQLKEALDRYGREAVVAYLISGHYRQPLAFGELPMEEAVARVERIRNFFRTQAGPGSGGASPEQQRGGSGETPPDPDSGPARRVEAFRDALADDFNTPRAMAELFELIAEANREDELPGAVEAVSEMVELVGLGTLSSPDGGGEADEGAERLMAERDEARAAKDFARADAIRDELVSMGYEIRDSADGPRLVRR